VRVAPREVERRAAEVEQVAERVAIAPGAEDVVNAGRERVASWAVVVSVMRYERGLVAVFRCGGVGIGSGTCAAV
jgi:hypothetical protein